VLRPDFTTTFTRGVLRLAGTFAGLLCATALFHELPPSVFASALAITALTFVIRCFGPAHYGITAAGITAVVVFMVSLTGVSPKEVMEVRAFHTAAGGAIALLAYWLWPTWERHQVPETMARMLDAFRDYARAIQDGYLTDQPDAAALDRTRVAARLARSNLEASIERTSVEPGASTSRAAWLGPMLASSHRLVHALMAMEAGIASRPAPPPDAFRKFANDVDLTLYYLAAALRGSPLVTDSFPDLRKDHRALVRLTSSPSPVSSSLIASSLVASSLFNVETDRVATSLTSLSEELVRYNSC